MKHKTTSYNKYIILTGLIFLPLLFLGCSQEKETKKTTKTKKKQKKKTVIKKQPKEKGMTLQDMISQCLRKGYHVTSRYDPNQNKTFRYCQFKDGTECRLKQFATGSCGPKTGAKKIIENKTKPPRDKKCRQYEPVCGTDGKTYANRCLLEKMKVNLKHEGPCKKEETQKTVQKDQIEFINPKKDSNQPDQKNNKKETKEIAKKEEIKVPKWVSIIVSLTKNSKPTQPSTKIKRCNFNSKINYLHTNNTNNMVSTLYSEEGEVICHPSRDFSNSCPNYLNNKKNKCTTIWEDKR